MIWTPRRDGSFTSIRSRQQRFVFNINARTQHSPPYFNALNSLSYGLKLGSLITMCLFTPGWLIQDKYCIQINVWKKSRSSFYHNGDPRGSRKTLLHCYAHFTNFQGGITNIPLGIHRCLHITSLPVRGFPGVHRENSSHLIVKEKIWNPKQNYVIVHLFTTLSVFWFKLFFLRLSLRRFFRFFRCLCLIFLFLFLLFSLFWFLRKS